MDVFSAPRGAIPICAIEVNAAIGNKVGTNSRLPAMRTAASTIVRDDARHNQGLVTASPRASRSVPMKALLVRFGMTGSLTSGATAGLNSFPCWPGRQCDFGSVESCRTCQTGHPWVRQRSSNRWMLASAEGLLRVPQLGWPIPFCKSIKRRTEPAGGNAARFIRTVISWRWLGCVQVTDQA
jgi:hypothetical protein